MHLPSDRGRLGRLRRGRVRVADTPLWLRLVVALLLLLSVGLAVSGLAAVTLLRVTMTHRIDQSLAQVAAGDGPFGHRPGGSGRGDGPDELNAFYVAYATNAGIVIGEPIGTGRSAPVLPALTRALADRTMGRPFTARAADGHGQWRVSVVPLRDGSGVAAIAVSSSEVPETVDRLLLIDGAVSVVVLVLLGGATFLVVRSSLRPLRKVEHTAAAIAGGDLSRRVEHASPRTEVGRLALSLNGMLGQVESAFEAQRESEAQARASEQRMRRFVADASHELRTPLTSIRGFAELHRLGAVSEPGEVQRLVGRVEDEARRMGLLVDELLLLARLDQQRPLRADPVDLLAVAADAVHAAQVRAPDRRIVLRSEAGETAPVVTGDDSRLRQVATNLLSNAVTHTPPGTPVTVTVAVRGSAAVLEVADEGPGLRPEQAERVFERFYRADTARTRASGGSGLGLSIVSALAAAHGGRVSVVSEPGRGATFRVELPLLIAASEPSAPSAAGLADPSPPAAPSAPSAPPPPAVMAGT